MLERDVLKQKQLKQTNAAKEAWGDLGSKKSDEQRNCQNYNEPVKVLRK